MNDTRLVYGIRPVIEAIKSDKEIDKIFIQSNPGLQSRFNRYFSFEHYQANELLEIFKGMAKKSPLNSNFSSLSKLLMDKFLLTLLRKNTMFQEVQSPIGRKN